GASIMVGGNIKGHTRVLTTATAMETSKGNFEIAIALSIILMLLILIVNAVLTSVQLKDKSK
ncbi:MAG: tungstate transporter permease, partial [Deltaproteobacteria bacterium]